MIALRTAKKNKVKLLYSLQGENTPIYETDDEGSVVYEEIDGEQVPVETGESFTGYQKPVIFYGNLSFYTGWSYPGVWGVTLNNADAILLMDKNELPIDETSRIWFQSEPRYIANGTQIEEGAYMDTSGKYLILPDGNRLALNKRESVVVVDPDSADFSVSRIIPSLNCVRYVLKGIER